MFDELLALGSYQWSSEAKLCLIWIKFDPFEFNTFKEYFMSSVGMDPCYVVKA